MDQGGLVALNLPLALSDHYLFLRCFGRAAGTSCAAPLGEDSHGGGHSGLSKNHQTFQASPITPRAAADPLDASTIPHQPTAATAAWCRSLPSAARRRPRLGALGGAGAPVSGEATRDGSCRGASLQPRVGYRSQRPSAGTGRGTGSCQHGRSVGAFLKHIPKTVPSG